MKRRTFVQLATGLALAGPGLALAAAPTDRRLVVVVLRGGLDALHAVPPTDDPDYRSARPTLAVPPPGQPDGALALDGVFGLHPKLAPLHPLYREHELFVLHAATTSYRGRSHFDGQNQLENGTGRPFGASDGWLNRAIAALYQGGRLGLALGPSVPLMIQGDAGVATWADSPLPSVDEDFLDRLAHVYAPDASFASTFAQSRQTLVPSTAAIAERGKELTHAATVAADFLVRDDGPRIAVVESTGWDTHFSQQRRLDTLFEQLSAALLALRAGLREQWAQSVVVVVSEFGRTVAENGSRGTDHGVGGLALVLGGSVAGGRVVGDWPGLQTGQRHEGRDLQPANAYEALFKGLLIEHLDLSPKAIEARVFPQSAHLRPLSGLLRR